MEMDPDDFEDLVNDVFDALPAEVTDGLENVAIAIEDLPEDGSLDLLGLYHGVDLTERDQYGFGEMPDLISLYRLPLLDFCADEVDLREQVRVTLVHEIGHYYGIDDEELHRLGWG
ncbi:metallopeptidase family protein [Mycetocola tolaasinivorans]|uniref:Metallopeptidase family protein n=1 Tax=Mycetocola tolaasinivorans TaxID=76635 RepID=A0A3L7A4X2_9MICO|nr:metallopeptidase family protein [Mycetocola tolaasinivorans]RLP74988.1 metallopeptidase family protein [Mycetocola tolaasinivorans]